jgi:hypothetical protein
VAQLLERVTLPDFRCWHFWDMPTVLKMSASRGRPEVIAYRQNDEIDPSRTCALRSANTSAVLATTSRWLVWTSGQSELKHRTEGYVRACPQASAVIFDDRPAD